MSIRRIANQGFSLHNILGRGDDVDVDEYNASASSIGSGGPNSSVNDRLFDFRGRLPGQRDNNDPRDPRDPQQQELPLGPLRLKVNMARPESRPESRPEAPLATPEARGVSAHRVLMLERQLMEAKERMNMLNQDRTARVRKAEEQARKALVDERTAKSQLDHVKAVNAQQISDLNRDLHTAEAEAKQMHEAYTQIDAIQADNQSLIDARDSLVTESTNQQAIINRMTIEATQFSSIKQRLEEKHINTKEENDLLVKQIATVVAEATRKQHELQTQNCASRVESETLKQLNVDLNQQIATVNQELVKVRSEAPSVDADLGDANSNDRTSQVDDLTKVIEQMRAELVQKDARYDQLKLEKQKQVSTPPTTQPSLSSKISLIADTIDHMIKAPQCAYTTPMIKSSTLPRITTFTHSNNIQLMSRSYLPIASGAENSDTKVEEPILMKLVVGDFREHIHNTLVMKGAIAPEMPQ